MLRETHPEWCRVARGLHELEEQIEGEAQHEQHEMGAYRYQGRPFVAPVRRDEANRILTKTPYRAIG